MSKKSKKESLKLRKVEHAKKQTSINVRSVKTKKCIKAKPLRKEMAKTSVIGRLKGTVLFATDLMSPIDEQWDAEI